MKRLVFAILLPAACTPTSDPVDEVADEILSTTPSLHSTNFPPEAELQQLVWQYCAMPRDGVTTYRGLTGTYQRLGLTGVDEPVRLALIAAEDDPHARGTFTGTFKTASGTAQYAGRFAALPDNPAIGAAFAFDTNADGENDKLYFVLAIRRSFGLVRGLCLAGADHPFLLSRTLF